MVQILAPLLGAAIFLSGALAGTLYSGRCHVCSIGFLIKIDGNVTAPRPGDSSINEPAVSAPNGVPITEGASIGTYVVLELFSIRWNGYSPNRRNRPAAKYMAPMETASAMMMESSSAKMMMESSSKKMMESTSTMMMEATSTKKMMDATSTMYGSGSSGNSGYDNCVMRMFSLLVLSQST